MLSIKALSVAANDDSVAEEIGYVDAAGGEALRAAQ